LRGKDGFNNIRQAMINVIMLKRVINLASKLLRETMEVVSGQLCTSIGAPPFLTRDNPIFAGFKNRIKLTLTA